MNHAADKTRVGLIGAGAVAKDLHLPALVSMPEVDVAWLCDTDSPRARQLAGLFSIPLVFSDIEQCTEVDIALVAVPVGFRGQVMQSLFKRGWNIFCEKPFALTIEEHDLYVSEARKINIQLGVAQVRRYCPATHLAAKLVRDGRFGRIEEVWANEGMRTKRTGRESGWYMSDPKAVGGGVLRETGSHLVDQLFYILSVTGFRFDSCLQHSFEGLDFETRFSGAVSNERQSDIRCAFEISRINDLCNGLFIQFTNFMLKCGFGFESPLEMCTLEGTPFAQLNTDQVSESAAFSLEWRDFIRQCRTGSPSVVNAESTRHVTSIIEQCYNCAKKIDVVEP